jgi:hypothetical protein
VGTQRTKKSNQTNAYQHLPCYCCYWTLQIQILTTSLLLTMNIIALINTHPPSSSRTPRHIHSKSNHIFQNTQTHTHTVKEVQGPANQRVKKVESYTEQRYISHESDCFFRLSAASKTQPQSFLTHSFPFLHLLPGTILKRFSLYHWIEKHKHHERLDTVYAILPVFLPAFLSFLWKNPIPSPYYQSPPTRTTSQISISCHKILTCQSQNLDRRRFASKSR